MRLLVLVLAVAASLPTRAQEIRPLSPGDVLTAEASPGQTVVLDVTDLAYDPEGYDGMRVLFESPSGEQVFVSPVYVFSDAAGRETFRIDDAEPGMWTASIGGGDRVQIVGALWATSTPPARNAHEAAAVGDLDALRTALAANDFDRPDAEHQTALMLAAGGGHAEVVRLLLGAGADVHATAGDPTATAETDEEAGEEASLATALHAGARSGDAETVRVLLAAGADPNAPALGGATPLHDAVWGSSVTVRLLLDAGADPAAVSEYAGTPADAARERIALIRRVAERGSGGDDDAFRVEDLDEILAMLGD